MSGLIRRTLFVSALLLIKNFGVVAQDTTAAGLLRRACVRINALPILFGSVNGAFELPLASKYSVILGANYWYSKKGTLVFNKFDQIQSGGILELRRYSSSNANSFFGGLYGRYRQVYQKNVVNYIADSIGINSIETPAQNQRWNQWGFGIIYGYQHWFNRLFHMEAFMGGGYYFKQSLSTSHPEWVTDFSRVSQIDIRAVIALGISF